MLKRVSLILALAVALLAPMFADAGRALAQDAAMRLTAQDRHDLARIEKYINSIRTVAARFMQVERDGRWAQGRFYLWRPGKMRIEYDPPVPILMVASGIWVIVYDAELEQTSYMPLSATPAEFLVRENLRIASDEFVITKIERGPEVIRITLHESGALTAGQLRLTFSDNPLTLQQWTVIEGDGDEIQVALLDAQFDIDLNPDLFKFVDPGGGPVPGIER